MRKRNRLFLILILCIISAILIFSVIKIWHYHEVKVLCNQIRAGKEIKTDIGDGITAPEFLDDVASIFQVEGPEIPLVVACECRNVQAIEMLLQNGADPNYFLDGRWSPLEAAFYLNVPKDETTLEIMRMLIEHGANPNLHASNVPLIKGISGMMYLRPDKEIYDKIVILLLDSGAEKGREGKDEILHGAAGGGNIALTETLIEKYGSDINTVFPTHGYTPLMVYICNPNNPAEKETVEALLRLGADKTIRDSDGKTAYDHAVEKGYTEIAELLK